MKKSMFGFLIATIFASGFAHAGFEVQDSNSKVLGFAAKLKCGAGMSCSISGTKVTATISGGAGSFTTLSSSGADSPTGGIVSNGQAASPFTTFPTWVGSAVNGGTSTTPSATTVYLAQIFIPFNVTLTGFNINNAATCGTNKYIVALFNSAGTPVANSALAGTLCSGASGYQAVAFTSTYNAVGPGVYWIGVYEDGTTDRVYTIPASGASSGLAGSVTGQTFGTVVAVTLPTTFTAAKGVAGYTY